MKKLLIILFVIISLPILAQDEKEEKEEKDNAFRIGKSPEERADKIIKNAVETIDGMDDPESGIPLALVRKSGGIIIFPKATKTSIGVGGQSGQGIALIRKGGGWSNPYYVKLQEISGGLQFGVQVSEIILLVKNPDFIKNLETADLQFGADVNATAGPDGTNMAVDATPDFEADIYTYQKSEGLFGGVSLAGGALIFSWKLNEAEYGEETSVDKIFNLPVPYNGDIAKVLNELSKMGL
jgi:lipid-binding SYLF domain-containing protein